MRTNKRPILLLTILLAGCVSNDLELEATIASLADKTVEIEPAANFQIDKKQVIESYRALVEITVDGGGTGDELRRLADLELESSLDNKLSDNIKIQKQGTQESRRAIQTYQNYLKQYPKRADNDLILYQLSRAYALETESEKSLQMLNRIATNFPHSKYIDEVQFRRGEQLFVEREYKNAESAYGAIVKNHPDSRYYAKATYKYGWSQFKQGDSLEALDSFIRLLDLSAASGKIEEIGFSEDLSRTERELLQDVVRVVSLTFSYEADSLTLVDYFRKHGQRRYEPLLYLNLGELYLSKTRVADASEVYLAFTQAYPNSRFSPRFHQKAIENYQSAGFPSLVLQQKTAFVNRYDIGSKFWAIQDYQSRLELKPILALHLNDLATHYHAQARATKKPRDFEFAAKWYRRFLDSFPDDNNSAKVNFLLAESLFDARQYPQAIKEYEKTAYLYSKHKNSEEAGYAALIAYDALLKQTAADQTLLLRQSRIKSAVQFTTRFPFDSRIAAVELQSAQQFFAWKDYSQASASASRLAENKTVDKKTKQAAWALIGHSKYSSNDFPGAEKAYLSLLTYLPKKSKQRDEIHEQIASSIYKQGEIARNNNDYVAAAAQFTRLGKVVPGSSKRIIADYDAATAYISLKDWPTAIKSLESFRKKYPKHNKWKTGVTEKLALAYSENGNQALAAREMLALSTVTKSSSRKRDLMWRAAELYQEVGNQASAINIYKSYVKTYPLPLEHSIELRHRIAEFYRTKDDTKKLRFWLDQIVQADIKGKTERSPRTRYLAATASMELIKPLHRSYISTGLTVPLKKSLKKKKKLMQQSIAAYTKAIKYQIAEVTTEATFQIAEIYHNFAKSLLDSQRPKGLNEEALEEYELLLEEQAYPFEEKAIDIHLSNFKRIADGSYDKSTRNSLRVLGEMMPFRFAKAEISDTYVDIQ